MIQLNINEEILKRAKALGLNSENIGSALIALIALQSNDIHLLDVLDDHSKERRALILYQTLERIGLLEENVAGTTYYKVTEAGAAFVNSIITKEEPVKSDLEEWIDDWVNLFPEGVKSGGKLIRSDPKSCAIKMAQFLKDYKHFKKETIFKATRSYLEDREKEDYAYTRAAIYFIHKKGEGSDLAAACENELSAKKVEQIETGLI